MNLNFKRRHFIQLTICAVFFFVAGFAYKFYVPRFEAWLLANVKKQSQAQLPVHIVPKGLSFHLFPLGAVLEDIDITPKKEWTHVLAPTHVGEVGATVNLFSLIRGQLRLSRVFVRNADVSLFLNEKIFRGSSRAKKFDFEKIYRLPVDELHLENIVLQGKLAPQNAVFRSEAISLVVENRYRALLLELNIPKVMVKPSGPTRPITVQMQMRTLLEAKEAQVSAFKIKADDSYLVASGRISGDFARGEFRNSVFNARAHVALPDVSYWLETLPQIQNPPRLKGEADFDLALDHRGSTSSTQLGLTLNADDVEYDRFVIGHIHAKGAGDFKELKLESLGIKNAAGTLRLDDALLNLDPKPNLKGTLISEKLELSQFLKNIGITAPVHLVLDANLPCRGSWEEQPELSCQGRLSGQDLKVRTVDDSKTVVEIKSLSADGNVAVTSSDVRFKSALKIGKSSGQAEGVVNYKTGFKIRFGSESLNLADVTQLSNLKLEGQVKVAGQTEGDAQSAGLDMTLQGTDLWLQDFPLGLLNTEVRFKKGRLLFDKAVGQIGVTRYSGSVDLDLKDSTLAIDAKLPFIELKDVFGALRRKTTIPLPIAGTGTGTFQARGPLDGRKLNYTLKSSFFRGSLFEENFDRLNFNLSAVNGLITADTVQLTKANGEVDVTGRITPEGVIDAKALGRKLRLEQSENILNLGLDLQGQTDFSMTVKGHLPRPVISLDGSISKMILGERPVDDSQFRVVFHPTHVEGSGAFLGNVVETTFNWPLDPQLPFDLKLKTHRWDFTNLFSVLSRSARALDFETLLTMEADLKSAQGGFWNASGEMKVSEFTLRKGASQMRAEKPMRLTFANGQVTSKDFEITSGDSYLRFESRNLSRAQLDASLNGKMDLSLLGLLTPFISDLRGNLSMSMDLKGSLEKPNMSGSAYIDKGYVKLRDFPHPFSSLRADILFNQRQILLNALRMDLAGGKAAGEGRIEFLGPQNAPIDIKGHMTDVSLNVPEGYNTKGAGTIAIRGSQFPYTMDIQYDVTGGEVSAEFGGGGGGATKVKASSYLPKFIYAENFQPFTLNLAINLKNPLLINNSLMQSQISGEMKASGPPNRLQLSGTLTPLPGGKVFFRDVPFEITTGYVEYQNSPPDNPRLYLMATTTVTETVAADQTHQQPTQYDVSLLVQGKAQPSPLISLTSQPPLLQKEIVSLLALGLTPEALDQSRKGTTEASTSTAIGAAILQKPVSKKLKDTFGVDVKLSSSTATQDTASTPKVTFTKQWTPKFGASASGTLESNPTSDVKLEYKVNRATSIIGSWEGKEQGTALEETKDTSKSVFGLDLEYKVHFK